MLLNWQWLLTLYLQPRLFPQAPNSLSAAYLTTPLEGPVEFPVMFLTEILTSQSQPVSLSPLTATAAFWLLRPHTWESSLTTLFLSHPSENHSKHSRDPATPHQFTVNCPSLNHSHCLLSYCLILFLHAYPLRSIFKISTSLNAKVRPWHSSPQNSENVSHFTYGKSQNP